NIGQRAFGREYYSLLAGPRGPAAGPQGREGDLFAGIGQASCRGKRAAAARPDRAQGPDRMERGAAVEARSVMPPVLPVDAAAFRRAAGQFPSGIVVVCTRLDANPHAMTVSAFASVSLQPLLVMFCAEKIARFHDTVLAAGAWSVSVLDEDSEKTARWLATRGRPLAGQLD